MRVSSLVALLIVVGLAAYFIFLTPQWAINIYYKATGYGPAETAADAQDKFLKAVKKRDLKVAALFCRGDFANHLKRAAPAEAELGPVIDGISEYMKNKGLDTDKSIFLLNRLDPFPTNVKTRGAPKERDATTAIVFFDEEYIYKDASQTTAAEIQRESVTLDTRMFSRVAMPVNLFGKNGCEAVKEADGWKLQFPLPDIQVQALDHYLNTYKAYLTGLTAFRRDVTNNRYSAKTEFERELVSTLQGAK